jgi:heme-degrading monooxygenase HmoA
MAPSLPWRATAAVDPEGSYVVTITRLPLRRHTRIPEVMRATWRIVRRLARSDGLVGYSLKADLIRKTFWTISVWESTDSLPAFVRSDVHIKAINSDRYRPAPWGSPGTRRCRRSARAPTGPRSNRDGTSAAMPTAATC